MRHLGLPRTIAPCLAALALACGEPEPVPFGLDRPAHPSPSTEPAVPAPTIDHATVRELPDPSPTADVGGATWSVAPGSVRALYQRDLDDDGDVDALALVASVEGTFDLLFGVHDGAAITARSLTTASSPVAGCLVDRPRFESLDPGLALATMTWQCANANGAAIARVDLLIDVTGAPRILERFGWTGRAGDGPSFVAADRDEDGHVDVIVELRVGEARATLPYRSTAAGMAREPAAVEEAIAALADEARASLRRHPEQAQARAGDALALWDAICSESEHAQLTVGTARGVPCGPSTGAARARAVLLAAHARGGRVLEALALAQELTGVRLREVERRLADEALASLASATPASQVSVEASPLDDRAFRRSTLAFPDEDHLLVLGSPVRNVTLADGTTTPGFDLDARITDPSGHWFLRGIERRCDGTVALVAAVSSPSPDIDFRTALIAPRPAPPSAPCPDLTAALRADADGYVPLGWAPQGLLVARLGEITLVPLDLSGALAGVAAVLADDVPAPAPILPGAATSDVSRYVLATDHGLLVIDRGSAPRLVRPEGYAHDGATIDAAISPSGARLAWLQGGTVHWCEAR